MDRAENSDEIGKLLTRAYPVRDLYELGKDAVRIEAEPDEVQAIVQAFNLESLRDFRAILNARLESKQLHITGEVRARVTQNCVISLEPFESELREQVDVRFSDDPAAFKVRESDIPGNEAEWSDPPDPILGETIDLGALVLEHLALGLDPHPRKPGAGFAFEDGSGASEEKVSPFAALKVLQERDKG